MFCYLLRARSICVMMLIKVLLFPYECLGGLYGFKISGLHCLFNMLS